MALSPTLGLRQVLWNCIKQMVPSDKSRLLYTFYLGVFPKWIFNALDNGWINPITFQLHPSIKLKKIILMSDMTYFSNRYQVKLFSPCTKDPVHISPMEISLSPISDSQYKRIQLLYKGKDLPFDEALTYLRSLYDGLGGSSNFLSVPPQLKISYIDIELFGSPFNTSLPYCSAFEIEKEWFGSFGSFFSFEMKSNKQYLANPPFDETMIALMIDRLSDQLSKTQGITVIITVPHWGDASFINDLTNSEYYSSSCELKKIKQKYYDYSTEKYIPATNSLLYIWTNKKNESINANQLAEEWAGLTN